jgi:hypothetical protein
MNTLSLPGISRRVVLSTVAGLLLLPALVYPIAASAQTDADVLPSWNDGPAKQAIIAFVQATTDKSSPKFVKPEDRIATFDFPYQLAPTKNIFRPLTMQWAKAVGQCLRPLRRGSSYTHRFHTASRN